MISQEAGTKIASAMKDVIGTAAGLAGFAVESARDLVQFMVRRGQMTQDEADRLIREAEEAHGRRASTQREAARHEPAKGTANVSAKRMAASGVVVMPEKTEKAAKAHRADKPGREDKAAKPAKRSAAQKKSGPRSAPKKRR